MSERAEPAPKSVPDPPERRKGIPQGTRRTGMHRSPHQDRSAHDASLRPLARALLALAEQLREEGTA
jgi:hypothetical protein